MNKYSRLLFFLLFTTGHAWSQVYNFRNYTADEDMPETSVNAMCEDRRGNIWIGTHGGGLLRFDGYTFVSYLKDDGLVSNTIYSIYEDDKGTLWIGTEDGVSTYDGIRFETFTPIGRQPVKAILQNAGRQYLFASGTQGLYRFDGKNVTRLTVKDGLISNIINCLYLDSNSDLWIGTPHGVGKYSQKTHERFTQASGLPSDNVRRIREDKDGNIWLATDRGASLFDGNNFTNFSVSEGLASSDVYSIRVDRKNQTWFGTARGITKYNGDKFQFYDSHTGQRVNPVICIYEDSGGNLWFGSARGLSKLSSEQFVNYPANDQMGKKIFAIAQAINGNILCGTSLGGVTAFDGVHYSLWSDLFRSSIIQAFYYTPDSVLWVGTQDEGAYRFDKTGFQKFTTDEGIVSDNITGIVKDKTGNVWLATADSGVSVLMVRDTTTIVRNFNSANGLTSNSITTIAVDSLNNIWLGTEDNGLLNVRLLADSVDTISTTTFSVLNGMRSNVVHSVVLDSKNVVYMGTGDGIAIYDGKNIFTISKSDGLKSNNIYSLTLDNDGSLWAGAERGVDKVSFGENFTDITIRHYGADEGFRGGEVFRNASCKDRQGNIWFGTANGLVKYNHEEDKKEAPAPLIHITGMKLFFDKIEETPYADSIAAWYPIPPQLTLPYHQNNLSFSFAGIYHQNPQAVRYKWKLEGFDKEWSPAIAEREATFSNLPPGTYTFKVTAGNEHNVWSRQPAEFTFTILTPFWEKWWVRYGAVVIVGLIIWLIVHHRIQRIKVRNKIIQEKLEMENSILELEQEAARLQMNPHFIFNSLNSIQGFITTNDAVQAKRYLAKFAKLMRLILENAREEFIPLRNEIDILENYLELEKLSTNHKFDFTISLDEDIDPESIEIPPMMLQPFIENAIIHGVKRKEGKGNIQISFYAEDKSLLKCEIVDNGIGRKRSAEINGQTRPNHKSTGIAVTVKRLEQYSMHRKLGAGVAIEDLEDDGYPKGTKVIISIPVETA